MSPLSKRYEPQAVEEEVLEFWSKNRIFEKTVKMRETGPRWNFLEGPPTTNGFMHVGHARGRAMKDAKIRYMTMRGYNVWRRGGWDMQGLPVELEVERKEGIEEKGDVEKTIGLDLFVRKCKELVDYYLEGWVRDSVRLGLWLDFDTAYQTRRDDYIEHVWHFVKLASEKGLLSRGYRINPVCPRCVTALSGHEVSQGYMTKTDPSIYVKFRLVRNPREYLVIWTTTPFTLLSNEMVSVHPDYSYAKVHVGDEEWWIAESLVETVMSKAGVSEWKVVTTLRGSDMLGWKYEHPFKDEVAWHSEHTEQYMHAVVTGEHVTIEDGTGLVHTAPGFGPDDFEMGKEYGVPVFCPVTMSGRFTSDVPMFNGMSVFEVNPLVPPMLRNKGLLVKEETIDHEYPHCWRCDTPLVYLADASQWFLKMEGVRDRLVELNRQIDWTPEWAGTGRFGDWLENADDWCISRSRIWGSPLPVWICERCGNEIVVGSRDELSMLAGGLPADFELHRPWVDRVDVKCPRCGGHAKREPFVVDCWLDSGMAHTASVDYLKDPSLFRELFPFDFITEAVDQSRGWFYSLLYTSAVMHDETPFKSCLSQGHVLDEQGGKMSKSKGNVVWAENAFRDVGADPFRLFVLSRSAPWSAMNYSRSELESATKNLNILWNVVLFADTYMTLDHFRFDRDRMLRMLPKADLEDRWLVSRTQSALKTYHEYMSRHLFHQASRVMLDLITEDISRVYLPLVKKRVWLESNDPRKMMAYDVMYYALQVVTRAFNVFTPFLCEKLHQDFLRKFGDSDVESINMTEIPDADMDLNDPEVERAFDLLQELRTAASHARNKRGVKLRHPVASVMFLPSTPEARTDAQRLSGILPEDLNTKEFLILDESSVPSFVKVVAKPNFKVLGPRVRDKMRQLVASLESTDVTSLRRDLEKGSARLRVGDEYIELVPGDLEFEETMPDNIGVAQCRMGTVYVDVSRTRELLAEGLIRDVTRRVQVMRKELDLSVEQFVKIAIRFSDEESRELAQSFTDYLSSETRARSLKILGPKGRTRWSDFKHVKDWEIEDLKIRIGMSPA
ncbi:MAG: isoleucine--tRNA ligase [Candidatus Thorarchaeota archaeon]